MIQIEILFSLMKSNFRSVCVKIISSSKISTFRVPVLLRPSDTVKEIRLVDVSSCLCSMLHNHYFIFKVLHYSLVMAHCHHSSHSQIQQLLYLQISLHELAHDSEYCTPMELQ